jgi:hypothetical protein
VRGARGPLVVLLALLAGWGVDTMRLLARLPGRVAVHFDAAGAPNGWTTPRGFVAVDAALLLIVTMVMLGGVAASHFLPPSLINIPHRDYWFAPERRRETRARLLRHMLWMVCVAVGLLVTINHFLLAVNLRPGPPRLAAAELAVPLALFLVAVTVWTVRLFLLFPRPRG